MKNTAIAALGVLSVTAVASANVVTNSPIATFDAANLGFNPVAIDLSTQPIAAGLLSGPANNTVVADFTGFLGSFPLYSGRLTSEVFANTSVVGPGVSDVVIRYTFEVFSGSAQAVDAFEFGVNTGIAIDAATLLAATQGNVADATANSGDPFVTVDAGSSGLYRFDFAAASAALAANQTYTWYVQSTGDVAVNAVDVNVTDGVSTAIKALAFVSNPGQEDLNVPTPGAVALFGIAGLAAVSRRRK